jgi:tRNA(Leu) C34 or U34 (ribose-2'-O)-methylase TrmL
VPDYLKAFYRMGKAYIALKKYQECIALLDGQKDSDLVALKKEAVQQWEKEKAESSKKELSKTEFSSQVEAYFKERKWILGRESEQLPEGVRIQFFDGKISIPVIVVYPEFSQFDLIAKTHEQQKIGDCLK